MADELKPQLIVFHTGGTIVAEIEEVGADIGEPDCKIINPYNIVPQQNGNATLQPWMGELTNQKEFINEYYQRWEVRHKRSEAINQTIKKNI